MAKKPAPLMAYSPMAVHCPCCGWVMEPIGSWNGVIPTRLVRCVNESASRDDVCELVGRVFEVDVQAVELRPA